MLPVLELREACSLELDWLLGPRARNPDPSEVGQVDRQAELAANLETEAPSLDR